MDVQAKYRGYIERQHEEIERQRRHEDTCLPGDFDYAAVRGLCGEGAVEVALDRVRHLDLDEALRARIELKPSGLAVHWRGLPPDGAAAIRALLETRWAALDLGRGLDWCDFDGGVELRLPGRDKGLVVDRILGEMGPDTVAAYLGDDLTDEDAFRAIRGRGAGILVRKTFRPTAADFLLEPPEEVLDFLARWDEAAGGGEGTSGRT